MTNQVLEGSGMAQLVKVAKS